MVKKGKTSGSPSNLPVALKKATTEMMVLHLLRERPMYTYEMMSAIEERSGGVIVFNTIYLSIYREIIQEYKRYIAALGRILGLE